MNTFSEFLKFELSNKQKKKTIGGQKIDPQPAIIFSPPENEIEKGIRIRKNNPNPSILSKKTDVN